MKDKLSLAAGNFRAEIASNSMDSMVFWGLVTRVETESNMMDVDIYSGNVETTAKNVYINTMVTNYGAGLRVIPKSGVTYALLLRESAEEWYHIGFLTTGIEDCLSDKKSDDEISNVGYIPLRRFLEEGETQLTSMSGNEIFLSNEGSILLKSQYGAYLNLDNMAHKLDGLFANLKYEMDGVRIRSGNVFRPVDKITREEILIYNTTSSGISVVKAEDTLTDAQKTNATLIKEFTVQIGTEIDEETGIDDTILSPSIATLSFGDKIIDEWGSEIKVDATSLKAILKFSEFLTNNGDSLSGLSLSFDHEGSLVIADTTNGNYIKFKTSTSLVGTPVNYIDTVTITSSGLINPGTVDYTSTCIILYKQPVHEILSVKQNNVLLSSSYYTLTKDMLTSTGKLDVVELTSAGLIDVGYFADGDSIEIEYLYHPSSVIPETDLTVFINKTTFNINKDGELYYHMENPDDSSKTTTITTDKTGTIRVTSSNAVEIKSGTTALEPSVLGTQLTTTLNDLLDALISHVHPSGVGPTEKPTWIPPISKDFSYVKSTDIPKIISPKVKNN